MKISIWTALLLVLLIAVSVFSAIQQRNSQAEIKRLQDTFYRKIGEQTEILDQGIAHIGQRTIENASSLDRILSKVGIVNNRMREFQEFQSRLPDLIGERIAGEFTEYGKVEFVVEGKTYKFSIGEIEYEDNAIKMYIEREDTLIAQVLEIKAIPIGVETFTSDLGERFVKVFRTDTGEQLTLTEALFEEIVREHNWKWGTLLTLGGGIRFKEENTIWGFEPCVTVEGHLAEYKNLRFLAYGAVIPEVLWLNFLEYSF